MYDIDDDKSSQSSRHSSTTGSTISRFFRRAYKHHLKRTDSAPTFCGYSLERDYCIDLETDRIFKEFLLGDKLPVFLPMVNERHSFSSNSSGRKTDLNNELQRRRKAFKKRHSDTEAIIHHHNSRRLPRDVQSDKSISYRLAVERCSSQDLSEDVSDWDELNTKFSPASSTSDVFNGSAMPPIDQNQSTSQSTSDDGEEHSHHQ